MKADALLDLLAAKHAPPEWAFLREVRCGTGSHFRDRGRSVRTEVENSLDAWAINHWSAKHRQRITYEIKVSRSDLNRELSRPLKRRAGLLLSNLFYFVSPEGIIQPDDLPVECGLLIAVERPAGLVLKELAPAPWRDTPPPPWHFVGALARRICQGQKEEGEVAAAPPQFRDGEQIDITGGIPSEDYVRQLRDGEPK